MRAYGYIRTSTTGQLAKHGPKRQEQAIREYAKRHGIEIVKIFTEDVSGTTQGEDRPVFTEMVSEILSNSVNLIIVENLSRLAREYRVQEQLLIYLVSKGIHLISADTEENVTQAIQEDPMKKALVQIQGIFSELERSLLVKKLQKARHATGRLGGRPSAYPKELKTRIRRLRGRGNSYGKIAERLNREGVPTTTGKPWTAQLVRVISI